VTDTAKIVAWILGGRKERNLRIHVEKMCLDIEGENDAQSDITTNFGHR
jgi:predicted DNA binding CopG/RHH family protein